MWVRRSPGPRCGGRLDPRHPGSQQQPTAEPKLGKQPLAAQLPLQASRRSDVYQASTPQHDAGHARVSTEREKRHFQGILAPALPTVTVAFAAEHG
jgi:hypothetical protein